MVAFSSIKRFEDIIDLIQHEYGEIGNLLIEDNCVSFEVYRCYYEFPSEYFETSDRNLRLLLYDKFDDPFYTLCYSIS